MATFHIDGENYESENLSENALAQINNVQIVDQKIAQLQQDLEHFRIILDRIPS